MKRSVIKYLLIQRTFFVFRILGLFWSPSLLLIAVFIKIGLPPFHSWYFKMSLFLEKNIFLFFSSIHKLGPLFLILKIRTFFVFFRVIIVLILAVFLMAEVSRLYYLIILSSIVHSGWIFLACCINRGILLLYFLVYTLLIISFFRRFFFKNLLKRDDRQRGVLSLIWLGICGLPPFAIFWLKVNVFSILFLKILIFRIVLIVVAVLSLAVYYRIFHLSVFIRKAFINENYFLFLIIRLGIF